MELEPKLVHAPELLGDYWFNSRPVSIREQEGNVILVDFWDFTCVNCIRTMPYVQEWSRKYQEFGLVTVGVHTPEFAFGKNPESIEKAIKRFGIGYPVVVDNNALIWSAFANKYWPARYLIDRKGYIRFQQYGEKGYQEFERAIQRLLRETGYRAELPDLMEPLRDTDGSGAVCYRATAEMFLGYLRSNVGNPEGYNPESAVLYNDPGIHLAERFYLNGKWMNEKEFLNFAGTQSEEGAVALQYEALEVNAVMNSTDGKVCEVTVQQDDKPVPRDLAGEDVVVTKTGTSLVFVDSPRMYSLVKNKDFGGHELKLTTSSPNLELYTFTFVSCVIPDLISSN